MIDFGFDKLALISAVALIVIGPEKLPRVARTVGNLLGKAQRYVADVKAEVNRSIELEELKKMKTEFEDAARNVEQTVSNEVNRTTSDLASAWQPPADTVPPLGSDSPYAAPATYRHPKKNWRLKRGAMPQWYKQKKRHPRPGAVGRGARRALPADAAFMRTPRSLRSSPRASARPASGRPGARPVYRG